MDVYIYFLFLQRLETFFVKIKSDKFIALCLDRENAIFSWLADRTGKNVMIYVFESSDYRRPRPCTALHCPN